MHNRVKALRKELGLSQLKFAELTGLTRSHVANIEIGISCSDRVLRDICDNLGINLEWLKSGSGEKYKSEYPDDELGGLIGMMMAEDNEFRKKLIKVLISLDIEDLQVIEKIAKELSK